MNLRDLNRSRLLWRLLLLLALPLGTLLEAADVPNSPAPSPYYQSAGTRRMAERLRQIADKIDPLHHPFENTRRANIFQTLLDQEILSKETPRNWPKLFDLQAQLSVELLNSGQTESAIEEFERFIRVLTKQKKYHPQNRAILRTLLATCYLRLGEQQNCITNHTIDSCLAPIRAGGVHTLTKGSEGAMRLLVEQLTEFPDDLRARWLLNIAAMTLGRYPTNIPPQWLIPPKAFESDFDIGRFPDVSGNLGLDLDTLSGSVVADDFDNDGYIDLMISARGELDQLRYFHNDANGRFTERTREAGLIGETGGLNIIQADYNNDGHVDLLVLRGGWQGVQGHHPCSLLKNNGNGTFDDVTEEAGLLRFHPTQTAVWFDYNNDGHLDLFIGNESTPGDTNACELFRNNGNGTFTECAREAGVDAIGYVKAVTAGDYNNDGRPDLLLSSRGEHTLLFRNEGPQPSALLSKPVWQFKNVAIEAGVAEPKHSFPAWFFDYDNDGRLDVFICGYGITNVGDVAADYLGLPNNGERCRLYHNEGSGKFADVTKQAHLDRVIIAMAGNIGDLDNDGWLDFYLGTGDPDLGTLVPNRMLRNAEGRFFQDVTTSGGFGHLQKGHGIAFADFDNDGDQDIYEVIGGALQGDHYRNVLFENPGHGNHWLKLKLVGRESNRSAIGARIEVVLRTASGERHLFRTVGSGASFGGSPLRQEIGLGAALSIDSVRILWPTTGKTQFIRSVSMDSVYEITEGSLEAVKQPLKQLRFPTGKAHAHH